VEDPQELALELGLAAVERPGASAGTTSSTPNRPSTRLTGAFSVSL
jgi:hypothetical protein